MKENEKKAFDFAAETTKQLITLSTAIIALTITFAKDITGGVPNETKVYIFWAWGLFIGSVFFGIWTLMALTGSLNPMKKQKEEQRAEQEGQQAEQFEEADTILISNNGLNVRLPSIIQILLFVFALVLTGLFGFKSINVPTDTPDKTQECIKIIKESKNWIDNPTKTDTLYVKELKKQYLLAKKTIELTP